MANDRDDELEPGFTEDREFERDDRDNDRGGRREAAASLKPPAIALIVVAVLNILFALYQIVSMTVLFDAQMKVQKDVMEQRMKEKAPDKQAADKAAIEMMEKFAEPIRYAYIAAAIFWLIVAVVMILGAMNMMKMSGRAMAMAAAILAVIPVLDGCCLYAMPVGIWSLVVLNKPEVKRYFK